MAEQQLPLVSIITCFLNEERFLQETIERVLAQDYPNWELLLVDDGSSDSSTAIAQDYAACYPEKIFYLHHKEHRNKGLSASRNRGIEKTKGKLIAFLDADDVWLPQKLSQQVAIMQQHPDVGMLCEASEYWYSWHPKPKEEDQIIEVGGGMAEGVYYPPQLLLTLYPLGNTPAPCPSGLMCRKSAIEKVGGFEEHFIGPLQMYEDQAFLSKIYAAQKVYVSRACNNRYRQRAGSLVQSVTQNGDYRLVREYYLEWLEEYMLKNRILYPEVDRLLEKAFLPYRQPLLHYLSDTLPAKSRDFIRRKFNKVNKGAKTQDNGSHAGV